MSIINIPLELHTSNQITCSICKVRLSLDKATAGLFDANDHQAFSCVSHLSEVELLIAGWAAFMACERQRYSQQRSEADKLYGSITNA